MTQHHDISDEQILKTLRPDVWMHVEGHHREQMVADARTILALRPQSYPLPDDLYDSKDWCQGNYASRVEWLHTMYENAKRERDECVDQLDALRPQAVPMTDEQRALIISRACDKTVDKSAAALYALCEAERHYSVTAQAGEVK
jgi:hypothetical protein